MSFLKQLWRFGARQQNAKLCVYAGRAWARFSCNIQTSIAQAILHRIPTGGHPAAQPTPVEVSVVTVELGVDGRQVGGSRAKTSPSHVAASRHRGTQVSLQDSRSPPGLGHATRSYPESSEAGSDVKAGDRDVGHTSHVGPQAPSVSLSSPLSSHVGTQAWTPLIREALAARGLASKVGLTSLSPSSLLSVSSPSTVLPKLTTVSGPVPSESEGEAHSSPSSQLAAHSSLLTASSSLIPQSPLFFGQSRQCKIQTDKESKTVDKEKDKCNRVAGWGGYINFSGTDAKGIPSNLVFTHPLSPTSTGGTRLGCSSSTYFNGCSPSLCCCSPPRDLSLVAGSSDMSLVASPRPASVSSLLLVSPLLVVVVYALCV